MQTILIVDDIIENIDVLKAVLKDSYNLQAATNGKIALKIAESKIKPDLILLDIMMPEMDGYEVCKKLKNNPRTSDIPIIFVTAKITEEDEIKGFEAGAVDYITKPIQPLTVLARVRTHILLSDQKHHLKKLVDERTNEIESTRKEIIVRLGVAAEYKDNETGMHTVRVSGYSELIAQKLGLGEKFCELIKQAAPMHDIGKIGIPDKVLLKRGKLNEEEWKIMKKHCKIGFDIMGKNESELFKMAREVALYHHERWDGRGYPNNLLKEEIPLSARIVAIADVFDALRSDRPYKKQWTLEETVEEMSKEKGRHFDPVILKTFLTNIDLIEKIRKENQ